MPALRVLGVIEPTSGTADDVYQATESKCKEHGLELKESCIAGGADAAAVNFGSKKGVLSNIKAKVLWLVQIHCVAHHLELALKDAFKDTYVEEIDDDDAAILDVHAIS
jgi:hypothetical protein